MNLVANKIKRMGKLFQLNENKMIQLEFNMSLIKLAICSEFVGKTEDREAY